MAAKAQRAKAAGSGEGSASFVVDHHKNVSVRLSRKMSMKDEPQRRVSLTYQAEDVKAALAAGPPRASSERKLHRAGSMLIAKAEDMRHRQVMLYETGKDPNDRDYHTSAHSQDLDKLMASQNSKLGTDGPACREGPAGIEVGEAATLQFVSGKNKITPPAKQNIWVRLLQQIFTGIFNVLLWGTVCVEVVLVYSKNSDDVVTPVILASVVVSAGILQWWTELKAESLMDALSGMQVSEPVPTVRRSGKKRNEMMVEAEDLLPGDIIMLKAGDRIPADVRILWCTDGMEVDNAALTGESIPEPRDPSTCEEKSPPTQAKNLAFYGTTVLKGNATALVFFIGDKTFLGKIAASIKAARSKSTLEIQIEHFVHLIAVVAVIVGLASLIANLADPKPHPIGYILANAAGALFAQVPEGLIPTVTISLMIASQKMSARNVLVRKLDAVETLGCVSVVCSDKTGTLTKGDMNLRDMVHFSSATAMATVTDFSKTDPADRTTLPSKMLRGSVRNNATVIGTGEKFIGSPTEVALMKAGVAAWGVKRVKDVMDNVTLFEIPFDSANKYMFIAEPYDEGGQLFSLKGAPERVAKFCKFAYVGQGGQGSVKPMTPEMQETIAANAKTLMGQAKRVLGIAERRANYAADFNWDTVTGDFAKENFLNDMVFIGLFGIQDPPKPGVKEAVEDCHAAGVKVVMITGDHPDTGVAIAKEISIIPAAGELPPYTVITDKDLADKVPSGESFVDDGSEEATRLEAFWTQVVVHARVFARVTPIHKQLIVQALQKWGGKQADGKTYGDIVAMTGDGVNDAPALKQANVGVAMGIRGTEVAKDASDIILLDDEFSSIVHGIEQGRLSSENLQKSIAYTLCSKVPQCIPNFMELAGIPLALNVSQVLAIDIGTDIWTAIAYAWQPKESALMARKPRHPAVEKIVNGGVLVYAYGYMGLMQMACCWYFYFSAPGIWNNVGKQDFTAEEVHTNKVASTLYYYTLVVGQIAAAMATTTYHESLLKYLAPNGKLNLCIVMEIIFAMLIMFEPTSQGIFLTTGLTGKQLLMPWMTFVGISFVEEVRKSFARKSLRAREVTAQSPLVQRLLDV
eukprot:CAMPEP_0117504914 /NCGR_PEP_ID=MMETSP0784-20121206/25095_1 /TAXON_ID=39447 /ORGANISM="" /LENGTH=1087 /DNA_ID=CAMNT_0005300285 /DNA_START=94 /DNA_END=3357 /DNA_ORIENTATION=+